VSDSDFHLHSPLVVRSPNWLGDAVMAFPAVRNLKKILTKTPLTVAVPEKLAALWQACPFVDQVIALDDPKNLTATSARLRAGRFQSAVLLPNSLRSAAEAWMAGIPQRTGYARGGRGLLLTHTVPAPARNPVRLHQRFYYVDLVAALGGPGDDSPPKLNPMEAPISDPDPRPVVAICPGAEYGPAKRWPVENFVAVARHFIDRLKARIVLLGAPGDAPIAEEFVRQLPEAETRAGQTSLPEFMAVLGSARLVLCNDSGAMHVAAALGAPTVAVFGSTEPQLTGPTGASCRVLRHHVPCSPCFLRQCPIDFACMKSITPEMVIAAAEELLN
jgi:heptosyltransferase-2